MILKGLYVPLSCPGLTTVMPFILVLVRPLSHALQLVQNAAAGARFHHTGLPSLASCFRIDVKILSFDFQSPNGRAPISFSGLSQSHALLRSLRSANQMLSMVPTSRSKHREDPSFAVAAPMSAAALLCWPPRCQFLNLALKHVFIPWLIAQYESCISLLCCLLKRSSCFYSLFDLF